jgi:hypothetical protein
LTNTLIYQAIVGIATDKNGSFPTDKKKVIMTFLKKLAHGRKCRVVRLCMGNQARVADNATVVSTSTRNFPNRLGR